MQPQSRKRKHNRETIHFNLLLIGSNSMQRGCRAINVSQGGMLLEWHGRRDDPEITEQHMIFVVGMVVDLLFIVGKTVKKSLNMAARVVRNEGNLIGIEFFKPQPKLLAILTSRTSQGTPSSRTASVVERTMAGTGWLPEKEVKKSLLISFFTGLTLAVILVVIGLGLKHYLLQSEQIEKPSQLAGSIPETNFGQVVSMISSPTTELDRLPSKTALPPSVSITAPASDAIISGFSTVSVDSAHQESELDEERVEKQEVAPKHQDSPATKSTVQHADQSQPMIPQTKLPLANPDGINSPSPTKTADPPMMHQDDPVKQQPVTDIGNTSVAIADKPGDWFINMIYLANKQSADNLTAQAHQHGFPVVQESARMRGILLWRLRIYGFATKKAAKEYAVMVQRKLGLDDFFIRKQQ